MTFDKDLRARINHKEFDGETMPFGQYVNVKITDLPFDYVHWFVENTTPTGKVYEAVKAEWNWRFAQSFGTH